MQAPTGVYKPTATSTCQTAASCAGTADEVLTTIVYGASGVANNLLPTAVTTASGNSALTTTTTMAYDAIGNKVSEDGPLAGAADTNLYTYNADRQVTQVVGPDPDGAGSLKNRSVKTSYNLNGQATSVATGTANADGSGFVELVRSETAYDGYMRKAKDVMVSGGVIQQRVDYGYDAVSRLECTATRMNPAEFASATTAACALGTEGTQGPDRIVRTQYDGLDRVTKVQSAYGLPYQRDEITNVYNTTNGTLASVADAKGNLTTYEYDGFQRLVKTRYPSPTTVGTSSTTDYEQLTYDAGGRLMLRKLRGGKQLAYTYDNLGRQTLLHPVNPIDVYDADMGSTYDLMGRQLTATDPQGRSISFTYDAFGRKLTETSVLTGVTMSTQYDNAGRRTRLTWSGGPYVTYDYDVLGEMIAIRENGATSGVGVLATFAYDDLGRRTGTTKGNGTSDTFSYDAAGRLATLAVNHATYPNVYGFSYNPAGQIVSRTMSNGDRIVARHPLAGRLLDVGTRMIVQPGIVRRLGHVYLYRSAYVPNGEGSGQFSRLRPPERPSR